MLNDNLLYLDRPQGADHPNILTYRYLNTLAHSKKLFARKFDMQTDSIIMDEIDKYLAAEHQGSQYAAGFRRLVTV